MAGMEAISLTGISLSGMTASKGTASVSTDGAKQFEQFLNKGDSAKQKEKSLAPVKEAKDSVYSVNRDYSKKEEITTAQDGQVKNTVSNEEVMQVLQDGIRDLVKENLGIDDEALDAVLESMGIMITDLLNPSVLQQFVLLAGGGQESTDFLVNEDLLSGFTNLMQAMEDFKTDNQMLIVSMMEKLEKPVTLEEFLQQEGAALTTEEALPNDETAFVLTEAEEQEAVKQETTEAAGIVQSEQQSKNSVKEVSSQTQDADTAQVQSVDLSEKKSAFDSSSDAESDVQDDVLKQNANDVLFSEEDSALAENKVMPPLFSEKPDSFLQDGVRFLKADVGATQKMQQMIDIVNQVSERIRSTVNVDTSSVELQLNPESLGKVYISIAAKQGVMTATFNVQSEEAKNALESQIITLRENLEAKNLKVESIEVQVSDFSFSQSNQAEGQEQRNYETKANKRFRYDLEEDTEAADEVSAEAVRRQVMRDSGGSIDFTA